MKLQITLGAFVTAMLGMVGSAFAQPFPTFAKDQTGPCIKSVATGGGKTFGIAGIFAPACATSNAEGAVWQRGTSGWGGAPFSAFTAAKVAVSGAGIPWALKSNGTVWKFNAALGSFNEVKNNGNSVCAVSLGVGQTDSDAWIVGCDATPNKSIWRFNGTSAWSSPQPSAGAVQIAVGSDNIPWVITAAGAIFKWNGSNFGGGIPGCAHQIGGKGWVVGCDDKQVWQDSGGTFIQRWFSNAVLQGISNDGLAANVSNGDVLLQGALTTFLTADTQTDEYTMTMVGNGFLPSQLHELWYDNPEKGAINVLNITTTATGKLDLRNEPAHTLLCTKLKMKATSAFSTQQMRVVVRNTGETTRFSTSQLSKVCP